MTYDPITVAAWLVSVALIVPLAWLVAVIVRRVRDRRDRLPYRTRKGSSRWPMSR